MQNRGWIMTKRVFLFLCLISALLVPRGDGAAAQDEASSIHVNVVLVQLSVAITDRNGNYVSGLHPEDFTILEDNIPEKTATFEEGNERALTLSNGVASDDSQFTPGAGTGTSEDPSGNSGSRVAGANV